MSNQTSAIQFLKEKLKNTEFSTLFFLQWEAFVWWIVMGLPGFPGMLCRNWVARMFFKEKRGMSWIQHHVTFVHSDRIRVGKNLGINSGTYINAIGGIEFGDYVLIGSNVTISSGKHPLVGSEPPIFARPSEPLPIIIGDDVWIGAGAVIVPGVTLAKGTVVGANSVITKSTEPYSVMAGVPARLLRKRI